MDSDKWLAEARRRIDFCNDIIARAGAIPQCDKQHGAAQNAANIAACELEFLQEIVNLRDGSSNFEWYSRALEVLQPLRYHLNNIIDVIDSHNSFCYSAGQVPIQTARVSDARVALELAEDFFHRLIL